MEAVRGSTENGICSNPFLEHAFKTDHYRTTITLHDDDTWSYQQTTTLIVPGYAEPFAHTDQNILHKIGEATPNPTALAAMKAKAAG